MSAKKFNENWERAFGPKWTHRAEAIFGTCVRPGQENRVVKIYVSPKTQEEQIDIIAGDALLAEEVRAKAEETERDIKGEK